MKITPILLSTLISIAAVTCANAQTQMVEHHDEAYFADFYVMQSRPMQFEVSYSHPKTDRVLVRIKDEQQMIIFAEKTLVWKRYHKNFDLSTMQDGMYTFELTDGDETFVKAFKVSTITERLVRAL